MEKLNIAQMRGRIINDPTMLETTTGKKLLKFRFMYYTPQATDKDGSHANFIEAVLWEKLAEKYARHLYKGLEVLVVGIFYQNRWEDETGKRQSQFRFACETIAITDIHFVSQDTPLEAA